MAHNLYISLLLLLILTVSPVLAQNRQGSVSGQVIGENGNAVEAATVVLKGFSYHTFTDIKGNFSITANAGNYTLVISRIGQNNLNKSVTIKAGSGVSIGTVQLSNAAAMHEVQVVGKTQSQEIKNQGFQVNVVDLKSQYNLNTDINQVLNRTSGVRIKEDGGLGSNFTFSLNGFTGRQVKFFLDGIPMDNFGPSLTLNNFPANMAERVEIYKGVVPISLGSDALGGSRKYYHPE